MDSVLITGGTGFVGSWMHEKQPRNLICCWLDRSDYNALSWRSYHWDYVVHLANVPPTHVIEYCKRNNARLLYCSSGIVYHTENDNEYRRNKMAWEAECLASGVDVVIARLFTFYGEGLDDGKAYTQFERAAAKGEPLRIWGDGNCVRSYMHGSDLGRWLWAILLRGERGEAYDVGDDTPVTMLELARRFSDNIIVENRTPDPMPVYLPRDTAKTRKLLE